MIKVLIPDSGPLISLAKINRLDILDRFKCPILITDVVEIEVTNGPDDLPDIPILKEWIKQGGNKLQTVDTTYGQLLKQNMELLKLIPEESRQGIPRHIKTKNSGELSIREFADELRKTMSSEDTALVLFEDNDVRNVSFGSHVHLMSHWSLALSLEKMGIIPSADDLFDQMEKAGRTAPRNPFDREPEGSEGALIEVYDTGPLS